MALMSSCIFLFRRKPTPSIAHFPRHPTEVLPDVPSASSRQKPPSPPSSERMMMMRHSHSEGAMWPKAAVRSIPG